MLESTHDRNEIASKAEERVRLKAGLRAMQELQYSRFRRAKVGLREVIVVEGSLGWSA